MATVAELKARLAKYANKSGVENVNVNTLSVSAAPAELPRSDVAAAPVSTEQSVVNIQTDLQPTTLTIVERPAETVQDSDNLSAGNSGTSGPVDTELDTRNPVHQNFLQKLADVEAALLARDPLMKTHLGEIHKHMMQYEEIANLLRPHEIAKIMSAQQAHTGMVLRAEVVGKSKASASKKAAKLGVGDI